MPIPLLMLIVVCAVITGFSWGTMWAERKKKPSMQPFPITVNGYNLTITAHKRNFEHGWIRYEDDRGILIAAFPESSLINPAKTEC